MAKTEPFYLFVFHLQNINVSVIAVSTEFDYGHNKIFTGVTAGTLVVWTACNIAELALALRRRFGSLRACGGLFRHGCSAHDVR